jgi:multimeric flavodoxin WrbA
MKALILNGIRENQTRLLPFQEILEREILQAGWECESLILHKCEIRTCIGCFRCWDTNPGMCFQKDQGNEIARKAINSDLLVFLTPLSWGGYSAELKKAIERMLGLLHPSFIKIADSYRHKKRYEKYPSVLGIAIAEGEKDNESEQIFNSLIERHSLNWHSPKQLAGVFLENDGEEKFRVGIEKFLGYFGVKT